MSPAYPDRLEHAVTLVRNRVPRRRAASEARIDYRTLVAHLESIGEPLPEPIRQPHPSQVNQDNLRRAVEMVRGGVSRTRAAREAHVAYRTLAAHLERLGEPVPKPVITRRPLVDPDKLEHALTLVRERVPPTVAARTAGITARTLRRHMRRSTEVFPDPILPEPSRADPEKVRRGVELMEEGASMREAARTVGLSPRTLSNHTDIRMSYREAGSLGYAMLQYRRAARQKGLA